MCDDGGKRGESRLDSVQDGRFSRVMARVNCLCGLAVVAGEPGTGRQRASASVGMMPSQTERGREERGLGKPSRCTMCDRGRREGTGLAEGLA